MITPKVSVIVPTYNRPAELERTLAALDRQTASAFEVIVADDGSDVPASQSDRGAHPFPVKHVRQRREGFRLSAARNLGATAAKGDLLIFLDCGTLAGPTLVDDYHASAERAGIGNFAAMGPTFGYDVPPAFAAHVAEQFRFAAADFRPHRYLGIPGVADYRELAFAAAGGPERTSMPWRLFWGRNIAMSAELYERAGGFDENFRSYGVEDIDLGYRIHMLGCAIRWKPSAWALEIPDVSDLTAEQKAKDNNANLRAMQRKYEDVWIEFYRAIRPSPRSEQVEGEKLAAVLEGMPRAGVVDLTRRSEERTVYFGVPANSEVAPDDMIIDPCFEDSSSRSGRSHGPHMVRSLGMATLLDDNYFDRAVITARFAPITEQWPELVAAEASRLSTYVEHDC